MKRYNKSYDELMDDFKKKLRGMSTKQIEEKKKYWNSTGKYYAKKELEKRRGVSTRKTRNMFDIFGR